MQAWRQARESEVRRSALVALVGGAIALAGASVVAATLLPRDAVEESVGAPQDARAWPGADAFSEWTHAQSSSGDGNVHAARATLRVERDGDAWRARCAGEETWTPAAGTPSTRALAPGVARGGPLVARVDVAIGDRVFVPALEARGGCAVVADGTWVEVVAREVKRVELASGSVSVTTWKGVAPPAEDGFPGAATAWWHVDTGLLVASEVAGYSGRSTTTLSRSNAFEPDAPR